MPSTSFHSPAPFSWTPPQTPAAPPSWRIARRRGRAAGWGRAGRIGLPALPAAGVLAAQCREAAAALPWRQWHKLARQLMLGAVIGMGGGWFAGRLAVVLVGV